MPARVKWIFLIDFSSFGLSKNLPILERQVEGIERFKSKLEIERKALEILFKRLMSLLKSKYSYEILSLSK